MKNLTLTIRGIAVNSALIAAYSKSLTSIDDKLTIWSNAAVLQAANHSNRNWLDRLFEVPALRLKNNDLSKLGKQVCAYIVAHYPRCEWDKEQQKMSLKKYNPNSPLADHFLAVGATSADEAKGIVEISGKFYTAQTDFLLTFAEFCNMEKPAKEDDDVLPSLGAKAVASQLEKAIKAQSEKRLVGSSDELYKALAAAKALYLALDAQLTAVEADKLERAIDGGTIDTEKAAELLKSGQAGKSTRAGGKVEAAA